MKIYYIFIYIKRWFVYAKKQFKKLRESNGLTQKEVAEKLNMDVSTFSKIERGVRGLNIDMEKN